MFIPLIWDLSICINPIHWCWKWTLNIYVFNLDRIKPNQNHTRAFHTREHFEFISIVLYEFVSLLLRFCFCVCFCFYRSSRITFCTLSEWVSEWMNEWMWVTAVHSPHVCARQYCCSTLDHPSKNIIYLSLWRALFWSLADDLTCSCVFFFNFFGFIRLYMHFYSAVVWLLFVLVVANF